jgi:tripartite ATP-independent transporter DctP family solute receptor
MARLLSRKQFLTGAAAASASLGYRPARAASHYVIRLGLDLATDHPTTVHAIAAAAKIKEASKGAVELMVFPNSQLGDDTHMLSNLRSGAIQMMAIGDNILATLVPSAAIDNIGFAFKSSDMAWNTLDGAVGGMVRADIAKAGLFAMPKIWDEGFRQITSSTHQINTPEDLHGFKIRVPPSPISLSLFEGLGASPVTINIAELYTAMQTHVVDGQENPFGNIETQKFWQVQKYCSVTDHMWVGYWMVANGAFWSSLPANYQQIVVDAFDEQAVAQRQANMKLDSGLEATLKQRGLIFAEPDKSLFQAALVKAGFYKTWKAKFSPAMWSALEQSTGPLS